MIEILKKDQNKEEKKEIAVENLNQKFINNLFANTKKWDRYKKTLTSNVTFDASKLKSKFKKK